MEDNKSYKNFKFKTKLVELNYSSVLSDDSLVNYQKLVFNSQKIMTM